MSNLHENLSSEMAGIVFDKKHTDGTKIPEMFLMEEWGRTVSKFSPMVMFDYITFENLLIGDLHQLEIELDNLRIYVKNSLKFRWDNDIVAATNIYGIPFKFSIHGTHLSIWDATGGTIIFSAELDSDPIKRKTQIASATKDTELYTAGKIHCSDCGEIQEYHEIGRNRYFAGLFCNKCWEGKWKAIEAKENYD